MGFSSHKALADKLGVSWQTVQLWEKDGGTAPKRNRLDAVADALGVTAEWLRSGHGEKAPLGQEASEEVRSGVQNAGQGNHDLRDAMKLLADFARATPAGRSFILRMAADAADKDDVGDTGSAAGD